MTRPLLLGCIALLLPIASACEVDGPNSGSVIDYRCEGGKCDTPGNTANKECFKDPNPDECRKEKAAGFCAKRSNEAIKSSKPNFFGQIKDGKPDATTYIRWECQDVDGVTISPNDDRGQEYCEYFAVVVPPPEKGKKTSTPIKLGRDGDLGLELDANQVTALEKAGDKVVGHCVFTSWHQDIQEPLPNCTDPRKCAELQFHSDIADDRLVPWLPKTKKTAKKAAQIIRGLGLKMTSDNFRMEIGFNSNAAAQDLIEQCMIESPKETLGKKPVDGAKEPGLFNYGRGCRKAHELFQTEWRRSDPTICTAAMRLSECGCGLDTPDENGKTDGKADVTDRFAIADALVPKPADGKVPMRGFRLGTWSAPEDVPKGKCHYAPLGEGKGQESHTVVLCDITANDLIDKAQDPKDFCRTEYAGDVVVHIPVPTAAVVCTPPADAISADHCGRLPWLVGREGEVDNVERGRRGNDDGPPPNRGGRGRKPRGSDRGTRGDDADRPEGPVFECKTGGPVCDDLREKNPLRACGLTCRSVSKSCSDEAVSKADQVADKEAKIKGGACNKSGRSQKETQAPVVVE